MPARNANMLLLTAGKFSQKMFTFCCRVEYTAKLLSDVRRTSLFLPLFWFSSNARRGFGESVKRGWISPKLLPFDVGCTSSWKYEDIRFGPIRSPVEFGGHDIQSMR